MDYHTEQLRKLMSLVGELGELGPDPQARRIHLLRGLTRIVGAELATLVRIETHPGSEGVNHVWEADLGWTDDIRRSVIRFYAEYGPAADPLARALLIHRDPAIALARRDVSTDREWYRSPVYVDQKRPIGLDDAIYSKQTVAPGVVISIGVHRASGDAPFSEQDRNLMQLVHSGCAWIHQRHDFAPTSQTLSPRLRDTLSILLSGAPDKEIATRLGISRHTVHQYVKSLLKAFGVASRTQLIARFRTR